MDRLKIAYDQLDACMLTIERLRETLYWYAESHGSGICISPCCIDNGRRARAALNFLGTPPKGDGQQEEGWGSLGEPVYKP